MTEGRFDRRGAVDRLASEEFDLLVIGGGATGAGVALDAASRGLRVALVERDDFGAGTSSLSSKMIHGGLRYLQQLDLGLVRQSLRERQRLLHNAPHLVRTLPFVMVVYKRGGPVPWYLIPALRLALVTYDLMGGANIGQRHRRLDRAGTIARMPSLDAAKIRGGYLYYDAQVDDSRMTMAVARTAALDHGAAVANHVAVLALLKDPAGKVAGATVDAGGGRRFDVRARAVVNATGVWTDAVEVLDGDPRPDVRPARGAHVVVPRAKVRNGVAAILSVPGTSGTVFAVPWGPFTYVGTTDTDYDGDLDRPYCTSADVRFLLGALNASTTSEVTAADVVGTWAGLRPLLRSAKDAETADISRRHRVTRSASGLVTVAGGKLTTFRQMAEDTVDEVLKGLGRQAPCRTANLRLRGAAGWQAVDPGPLDAATRDHLVGRYGAEAADVIALVAADPALGAPLVPGLAYLRAEAVHAVRNEMAATLDDVLSHRTRARVLAREASAAAAESVAALVGAELGWTPQEQAAQAGAYRDEIRRERSALATSALTGAERGREPGWLPGLRLVRASIG